MKTCVVLISGLPATGKSAIAKEIAALTGFTILSHDSVTRALRRHDLIPNYYQRPLSEALAPANEVFLALIEENSGRVPGLIIDGMAPFRAIRQGFRNSARQWDTEFLLVYCQVSDRREHRRRIEARSKDSLGSELGWKYFLNVEALFEPPGDDESHIEVDSSSDLHESIRRLMREIHQIHGSELRPSNLSSRRDDSIRAPED